MTMAKVASVYAMMEKTLSSREVRMVFPMLLLLSVRNMRKILLPRYQRLVSDTVRATLLTNRSITKLITELNKLTAVE